MADEQPALRVMLGLASRASRSTMEATGKETHAPLRVPTFVVVGGGDVGATHVRQLLRAIAAGRLDTDRIRVVDRDPACVVSTVRNPRVQLEVASWPGWLDAHLGNLGAADHLVPYHWAPHLLVGWLAGQVVRAGGRVGEGGAMPTLGVPYERATAAGDAALSYATWLCPPLCIEPALCPHTRGPRDWSLAADLERPSAGDALGRVVFRCLHLVYGVGTVRVADILEARDLLVRGLAAGTRRYRVATSSHCHGLARTIGVEPST